MLLVALVVALAAIVVGGPAVASAATFSVNSVADPGDGVCDTAECTLREAIDAANSTAGVDQISFLLPGPAPHRIVPTMSLPAIRETARIDATTQPGYAGTPVVEIDGSAILTSGAGIDVDGPATGGTIIRGLSIGAFPDAAIRLAGPGGHAVEGNYLGVDSQGAPYLTPGSGRLSIGVDLASPDNLIGGTTAAQRNVISGNAGAGVRGAAGLTGNVIEGNYIGTDPTGGSAVPNTTGLELGSSYRVGGAAPGAGNLISGNARAIVLDGQNVVEGNRIGTDATGLAGILGAPDLPEGILAQGSGNRIGGTDAAQRNVIAGTYVAIALRDADGDGVAGANTVQGNYVGVAADGRTALAGQGRGVDVLGTANDVIGGTAPGAGNVISGVNETAVSIADGGHDNQVLGNEIGVAADGTTPVPNGGQGPGFEGVELYDAKDNRIGGTEAGAGNVIAHSAGAGVTISGNSNGDTVAGNAIYANGGPGIDLGADGVTANDPDDADSGPNGLLNSPVIVSAFRGPTSTTASAALTLPGPTGIPYRVEFFATPASDACDPAAPQARELVGSTLAYDSGTVTAQLGRRLAVGDMVTATVTAPDGATSELSQCSPVGPGADVTVTQSPSASSVPEGAPVTFTITVHNDGPDPATSVAVDESRSADMSFVTASAECAPRPEALNATCDIGTLAAGATRELTVTLRPSLPGAGSGSAHSNTAFATADTPDADTAGNLSTASVDVTPASADLAVTQQSAPAQPAHGDLVTFTYGVANRGPSDATGVVLTSALPAGLSFVAASDGCTEAAGEVTCAIGDLSGDGAAVQRTVTARATRPGTLTATTASVTAAQADPDSANNQASGGPASVTPVADLALTQASSPAAPAVGDSVTYTYTLTNNGPSDATGVVLTSHLAGGLAFESASPGCANAAGVVTCDVGAVPANGAPVQRTVTARATRAGTLAPTTANVSGAQTDSTPASNTQTQALTVRDAPAPAPAPAAQTPAPGTPPSTTAGGGSSAPPAESTPPVPAPVVGKAVNAAPVSGTVLIKVNGRFVPLTAGQSVPFGATVDARHGVVTITSAIDAAGHTQSANFGAGMFVLRQVRDPDLITELVLTGGDFRACPTVTAARARRATARAARARRMAPKRRLWGDGHGRFRTRGRYGSATVRGTKWVTEDRCDGTNVSVKRGLVAVRDIPRRKTVLVPAGRSYFAKAPARTRARAVTKKRRR
jgi:uncharacterized repeat protein (TIGR01451 family)/CSLREA domain-containing protein